MEARTNKLTFNKREFKGSRLRCLQLTSLQKDITAAFLTAMVSPHATVQPSDVWLPCGMLNPKEVELGKAATFLSTKQRQSLTNWWFGSPYSKARTPNWDIVSHCTIAGRRGILLVEAKAHPDELGDKDYSKSKGNKRGSIESALADAQRGLNAEIGGWSLSARTHYQLSNRFAWAWKIASMGIPTVLVYLGFINATEMITDARQIFRLEAEWETRLREYANGVIPPEAWSRKMMVNRAPLIALIRASEVTVNARLLGLPAA